MKEKKHVFQLVISVIIFTVLLIYFVNHLSTISTFLKTLFSILFPFLIGCGIAFVLNIPMRNIEHSLFKDEKGKLYKFKRPISMVLTYIAALLFVALVVFVVVPEVANTLGKVQELLPGFLERLKEIALSYTKKYPDITKKIMEIEPDYEKLTNLFANRGGEIMSATVSIFSSIIGVVIDVCVGIVFSAYILAQKEKLGRQCKLVLYAICKEKTADEWMVFGKVANTTFSKFFTGQFREAIILGVMFMIAMAIVGIDYPLTIGVLIAFTALIPVFGAFIGLFIGCFLILVVAPKKVLWFIILFFVLQFIENYFIYPKLVGGDIGLPAIWVLLAVLVGGDLMGVIGMLIFIPLASVLYSYFRIIVYRRIKRRNINVDEKQVEDDVMPLESSRRRLFSPKPRAAANKNAEEETSE